MSHVLKVFLLIISAKFEAEVSNTQFEFTNGVRTREAIISLKNLTHRCRDMNVDVYACFIDFRKQFDCVIHTKFIEILRQTGIDEGHLSIIAQLYWNQTAEVRMTVATSEEIPIRKSVRQGCVL